MNVNRSIRILYCLIAIGLYIPQNVRAQKISIQGRVTDAETGEGMPFVNVFFSNQPEQGTTTNFDGFYKFQTSTPGDTLVATYMGYAKGTKTGPFVSGESYNFQLRPFIEEQEEITIEAGENPAHRILREAVSRRKQHDKRSLSTFNYESYNKIEAVMDKIPKRLHKTKMMRKIHHVLDSAKKMAGEDGETLLPFFISESLSDVYVTHKPYRKKEVIKKTKITGIGLDDGSFISQLIGSTFQEYNFYENRLNIFEREFVSPISSAWKVYYETYLEDTVFIGEHECYQIELYPKREQDLAFFGTIWITTEGYALKQVDLGIRRTANLNYVDKFKIQQKLSPTDQGPWVPIKTRLVLDIMEVGKATAGIIAKGYFSNKDYQTTEPKPDYFYDTRVQLAPDARESTAAFWDKHRHDSLTQHEQQVYQMIDTIRNIPIVKSYVDIANIAVNGYYEAGPVDIGPYLFSYAWNDTEGHRIRLGGRTNEDFSRKIEINGYGAYGFMDERFKYGAGLKYISSRIPWTEIGYRHQNDLRQVAFLDNNDFNSSLFDAFIRWGNISNNKPIDIISDEVYMQRDIFKFFTQRVRLRHRYMNARFDFSYYTGNPTNPNAPTRHSITTTELIFESRYAKNEILLINDNDRVSLGTEYPIFYFSYMLGLQGFLGGQYHYNKLYLGVEQRIGMGLFGTGRYLLEAGIMPNTVPYPLLIQHLGNESVFHNDRAYNLMSYFEFVSDRYASLFYFHNFNGALFNRIPLLKKLKLRAIAEMALIYGTASQENTQLIKRDEGELITPQNPAFDTFARNTPYAEIGYGIDNIFTFARITFLHRLTYYNKPQAQKFGIKFSAHFKL